MHELRLAQREAHATHAQGRIGFFVKHDARAIRLVGTKVQGPDGDRQSAHAQDKIAVGLELFFLARYLVALQVQELGSVESDAGRSICACLGNVGGKLGIGEQADFGTIDGTRFQPAQTRSALILLGNFALPMTIAIRN